MALSGLAVAYSTIGGVVLISGVSGNTVAMTLKSLLKGKYPGKGPQNIGTPQLGVAKGSGSGSGSVTPGSTSSAVANDALGYVGNKYVWGGAPGTQKSVDAGTDCSGFCNMVIGRDLGLPIPGYGPNEYSGSTHGPTTLSYLSWSGVTTIQQSQLQPGDLVVWPSHMGIWIGNSQMISALDTTDGVKVTSLADGSPTGEPLTCKRLVNA